ncbi:MAG: GNAT family N-acetyltransferase [Clostridia bacterium]|nr:GNAT family N-acetyltransferase [Clostridia bacterium]
MDCTIRPCKLDDAESMAELLNNKKIMDNLRDGLPYPYTADDAREYINFILNSDKNSTFAFAIVYEEKVVGCVGVFRQDNVYYRTAEMGYYVGEKYWNMGIATCAIRKVCKNVFDNTNIIRIYAEPFARNIASCRVLEKAGFTCEGTLRSSIVKNGIIEDSKIYAIIKEIKI